METLDIYCPKCGSKNYFITKKGKFVCRDCWFKGEREDFENPKVYPIFEIKRKEL